MVFCTELTKFNILETLDKINIALSFINVGLNLGLFVKAFCAEQKSSALFWAVLALLWTAIGIMHLNPGLIKF